MTTLSLVESACRRLESETDWAPLGPLAAELGVSTDRLRRAFVKVLGVTPRQYADSLRLERLRGELRAGTPATVALFAAGYGSTSRLYEATHDKLGMTPASYGAGGRGATVGYAIAESVLGWLCVGATERGLCHVDLADQVDQAEARLREALPAAVMLPDDDGLAPAVGEVLARLEGREPHLGLPLDVRGTAFQRRVWEELRRIPLGETRSYGEVAEAIGEPGAARAVGTACGANPVAIVVPCHRVVRGDGSLGGYGLGVDRKARLLAVEGATPTPSGPAS